MSERSSATASAPSSSAGKRKEQNINITRAGQPARRRLQPRQELFAQYCLVEPSAARAAIRAGYSPRSARNQAYRLLANDDIRRRIEGGLSALRARDAAVRDRLLAGLERVFSAAMECGRIEPALGALNAQVEASGILHRSSRLSAVQRAEALDLALDEAENPAPGAVGPRAPQKL